MLTDSSYAPGRLLAAVTPSNTVDLPRPCRALYVGVGGNITVHDMAGTSVLFTGVPQGTTLIGEFRRILATGTTASALVGYV